MSTLGKPMDRVDGLLKVTGQARYAGEFPEDGLLFGSVVSSTIANGRVLSIDASKALALPGVVAVIDHNNRPKLASYDEKYEDDDAADGSPFRPLYNDNVLHSCPPPSRRRLNCPNRAAISPGNTLPPRSPSTPPTTRRSSTTTRWSPMPAPRCIRPTAAW